MKLSAQHSVALLIFLTFGAFPAFAQQGQEQIFDNCLLRKIHMNVEQDNLEEIKLACQEESAKHSVSVRHQVEKQTEDSPFVITPYRQNYFLPVTNMSHINTGPYTDEVFGDSSDELMNQEIKFQISFKMPLVDDIFYEDDELYFGFTMKSFWQAYAGDISSPFRDTNYRPEIFYETTLPFDMGEGVWFTRVGFEHESNGRTEELSRSWNRVFAGIGYEEDDFMVYLEPWVNTGGMDTDNKDIEDYLGHYELTAAYKLSVFELSGLARYNFDTGYGGVEVGVSFPLLKKVRGYVQYYQGYGESLIDYNYNIQRIGVGVLLTDLI